MPTLDLRGKEEFEPIRVNGLLDDEPEDGLQVAKITDELMEKIQKLDARINKLNPDSDTEDPDGKKKEISPEAQAETLQMLNKQLAVLFGMKPEDFVGIDIRKKAAVAQYVGKQLQTQLGGETEEGKEPGSEQDVTA